uniref:Putative structural protein n=1 Tax=viral metagenome TaxID=1070528 RepID=A0A6M3KHI2_9ZZZZ
MAVDIYTKLLLHFDNNYQDFSGNGYIISDSGSPSFVLGKFSNCIDMSGGDYLIIPDHIDFEFGGDNFTIDFWFYPRVSTRMALFAGTSDCWFGIDYHQQGTRNICLWVSSNGSSWDLINSDYAGNGIGSLSLTLNNWNHVEIARNDDNWLTFINGVKDIDITVSGSIIDKAEDKQIGKWGVPYEFYIDGMIDEFRITKGIARHVADFTPFTNPYGDITVTCDQFIGKPILGGSFYRIESLAPYPDLAGPEFIDPAFKSTFSIGIRAKDVVVTPTIVTAEPFSAVFSMEMDNIYSLEYFRIPLWVVEQELEDFIMSLQLSGIDLVDFIMDLRATLGLDLIDSIMDLRAVSGLILENFSMHFRAIGQIPEFKSYVAQRISSILKDTGL